MKKALCYLYLFMPTTIALAHGDGDSHIDTVDVADPSKRIYVMIGVGILFVAIVAWFIWSKRKQ